MAAALGLTARFVFADADDVPAEMAAHPATEALWLGRQAALLPNEAPALLIRQAGALLAAEAPAAAVRAADEALRKISPDDRPLRQAALRARAESRLGADDSHGALADALTLRALDPGDESAVRLEHRIRARLYIDASDRAALEPLYEIARQHPDAGPVLWDYAMLLAERGRVEESKRVRERVYPLADAPTPAILEALELDLSNPDGPSATHVLSLVARLRERDPANPRWDKLAAEYAEVPEEMADYPLHANSRPMEGPERVVELMESPAVLLKAFDVARARLDELVRKNSALLAAQSGGLADAHAVFAKVETATTAAAAQKAMADAEAILAKLLPEDGENALDLARIETGNELEACLAARSEIELPPARAQSWEKQAGEIEAGRENLNTRFSAIYEAREKMAKVRELAGQRQLHLRAREEAPALLAQGDAASAMIAARVALQGWPDDPALWFLLGSAQSATDDEIMGAASWHHGLSLAPAHAGAARIREALAALTGRATELTAVARELPPEAAFPLLNEALALDPASPALLQAAAEAARAVGEAEVAERLAVWCWRLGAADDAAQLALARRSLQRGSPGVTDALIRAQPGRGIASVEWREVRALLAYLLGDTLGASRELEALERLEPHTRRALSIAEVLGVRGDDTSLEITGGFQALESSPNRRLPPSLEEQAWLARRRLADAKREKRTYDVDKMLADLPASYASWMNAGLADERWFADGENEVWGEAEIRAWCVAVALPADTDGATLSTWLERALRSDALTLPAVVRLRARVRDVRVSGGGPDAVPGPRLVDLNTPLAVPFDEVSVEAAVRNADGRRDVLLAAGTHEIGDGVEFRRSAVMRGVGRLSVLNKGKMPLQLAPALYENTLPWVEWHNLTLKANRLQLNEVAWWAEGVALDTDVYQAHASAAVFNHGEVIKPWVQNRHGPFYSKARLPLYAEGSWWRDGLQLTGPASLRDTVHEGKRGDAIHLKEKEAQLDGAGLLLLSGQVKIEAGASARLSGLIQIQGGRPPLRLSGAGSHAVVNDAWISTAAVAIIEGGATMPETTGLVAQRWLEPKSGRKKASAGTLTTVLAAAKPGDVIELEGTTNSHRYTGPFVVPDGVTLTSAGQGGQRPSIASSEGSSLPGLRFAGSAHVIGIEIHRPEMMRGATGTVVLERCQTWQGNWDGATVLVQGGSVFAMSVRNGRALVSDADSRRWSLTAGPDGALWRAGGQPTAGVVLSGESARLSGGLAARVGEGRWRVERGASDPLRPLTAGQREVEMQAALAGARARLAAAPRDIDGGYPALILFQREMLNALLRRPGDEDPWKTILPEVRTFAGDDPEMLFRYAMHSGAPDGTLKAWVAAIPAEQRQYIRARASQVVALANNQGATASRPTDAQLQAEARLLVDYPPGHPNRRAIDRALAQGLRPGEITVHLQAQAAKSREIHADYAAAEKQGDKAALWKIAVQHPELRARYSLKYHREWREQLVAALRQLDRNSPQRAELEAALGVIAKKSWVTPPPPGFWGRRSNNPVFSQVTPVGDSVYRNRFDSTGAGWNSYQKRQQQQIARDLARRRL